MTARPITTTSDQFEVGHVLHISRPSNPLASGDVPVPVCGICGAVVLKLDHHRAVCPPLKPEPLPDTPWESGRTIADRGWLAAIILRHSFDPASYRGSSGHCGCNDGDWMTRADHADHVAEMVYRGPGGGS